MRSEARLGWLIAILALGACRSPGKQRPADAGPVDACELYTRSCVPCHGVDGRGGAVRGVPDLTRPATQDKSDEALRHRIRFGAGGRMPGFAQTLDAEEIGALVNYVRALSP